jgi:DNA mismatch repair protein MSH4
MEMKEICYILQNLTSRSFIIIDELGRGTSNIDGTSLAFSIAESLLASSSFTLFVTHYTQLTVLSKMYSNVTNIHLKTTFGALNEGLTFFYEIGTGPCEIKSGYGVMVIL